MCKVDLVLDRRSEAKEKDRWGPNWSKLNSIAQFYIERK